MDRKEPSFRGRGARGSLGAGVGFSTDRKSTRLNSSHTVISYAVFCLKKKKNIRNVVRRCPDTRMSIVLIADSHITSTLSLTTVILINVDQTSFQVNVSAVRADPDAGH